MIAHIKALVMLREIIFVAFTMCATTTWKFHIIEGTYFFITIKFIGCAFMLSDNVRLLKRPAAILVQFIQGNFMTLFLYHHDPQLNFNLCIRSEYICRLCYLLDLHSSRKVNITLT